jgi:hypothetical protein
MKNIIDFAKNYSFELFMYGSIVFGIIIISGIRYFAPECVQLSSKEWVCTKSAPNGLATQCNEYQREMK